MRNSCMSSTETNPLVPPCEVNAGTRAAQRLTELTYLNAKVCADTTVDHEVVGVATLSH